MCQSVVYGKHKILRLIYIVQCNYSSMSLILPSYIFYFYGVVYQVQLFWARISNNIHKNFGSFFIRVLYTCLWHIKVEYVLHIVALHTGQKEWGCKAFDFPHAFISTYWHLLWHSMRRKKEEITSWLMAIYYVETFSALRVGLYG